MRQQKKYFWPIKREKYFLLFHHDNLFWHKPSNMKLTVMIQSFTRRQHRAKIHLPSKLWALSYWLTPELAPVSPTMWIIITFDKFIGHGFEKNALYIIQSVFHTSMFCKIWLYVFSIFSVFWSFLLASVLMTYAVNIFKLWLKITHICLFWAQIFANLDVWTHISFPITVIW